MQSYFEQKDQTFDGFSFENVFLCFSLSSLVVNKTSLGFSLLVGAISLDKLQSNRVTI